MIKNGWCYLALGLFVCSPISLCLSQDSSIKYPYPFEATGNPIITHIRTADPSAHVWADGKLWLYCSHDMDDATSYYSMDGYHVFSTGDLVHWTDWGEVLHSRQVKWGGAGTMWAPDCAYKNGKYFFYFPHKDKTNTWRTGVAISDKPQGPFVSEDDYIEGTSGIDPCCFIDDDGSAYLYFGKAQVAKLKDNMKELAEAPRDLDIGTEKPSGLEGSYMHKRNGLYYFSWSSPSKGCYSIGKSPYGPFEFKGAVKAMPPGAQDHHSILDFKGKTYYFYHVGDYLNGGRFRRNICIDELHYNDDGTIQKIVPTKGGEAANDKNNLIPRVFDQENN